MRFPSPSYFLAKRISHFTVTQTASLESRHDERRSPLELGASARASLSENSLLTDNLVN
ncbi:hypothetical protein MC7420_6598 [Coleofasciculus chthonoplastes PCC 7420]|uniref:Uncharacterized protein n=1 Tax=Coleofasciculus chthonoplastes PCC 7420 TaxID=118168 RepID=B4W428_9CYAN|nr:hypothetical protein MC7420_6598 [Coleofasciculus chthonoplastes PCC 7420]